MRIVLFSDTYPPQINGVATATFTLAETLKKYGESVLVVTVAKEGEKRITYEDDVIRIPGITVKRLYKYKFAGIYSQKVYDLLKKFKPDLIHVQTEVGIGIFGRIAAKNLNIPLVYTYHTMYEDYTYYVTGGWRPFDVLAKKAVGFLSAVIGDSTTEFVTTSNKTKDALKRYGVKKYINVVPNGLDFSSLAEHDSSKVDAIRNKYDLNGKTTLLILGRLAKEKNNELVLKLVSNWIITNKREDIVIMVVGDGPDKANLEKLSSTLKMDSYVKFVGAVDHSEVKDYYHASDIYISASTSETQGLTYIEAMASNLIVLAKYDLNLTNVIDEGKTGYFFTDNQSFENQLTKMLNLTPEQKSEIISKASRSVDQKYSLKNFYERIINVYRKAYRRYW